MKQYEHIFFFSSDIKEYIPTDKSEDSISTSVAVIIREDDTDRSSLKFGDLTDLDRDLSSVHLSQSIDSNMDVGLVATGPDPYDKLKVKQGEIECVIFSVNKI